MASKTSTSPTTSPQRSSQSSSSPSAAVPQTESQKSPHPSQPSSQPTASTATEIQCNQQESRPQRDRGPYTEHTYDDILRRARNYIPFQLSEHAIKDIVTTALQALEYLHRDFPSTVWNRTLSVAATHHLGMPDSVWLFKPDDTKWRQHIKDLTSNIQTYTHLRNIIFLVYRTNSVHAFRRVADIYAQQLCVRYIMNHA